MQQSQSKINQSTKEIRELFPIFKQTVQGKPLAFLDSAASAQKPLSVQQAMTEAVHNRYANVHRGNYHFSQESTQAYEKARQDVANWIGSRDVNNIVFTKNATEAVNLVARSFSEAFIKPDDHIICTIMEHHANLVPWLMAKKRTGCRLSFVTIKEDGSLCLDHLEALLKEAPVKLLAVSAASNVLGTVNPIKEIVKIAHAAGAKVLVDGAQAIVHEAVDVADLDCDFYVFTGHKIYGPTGIGVLYGKQELLANMPPYLGGGEMIEEVSLTDATFTKPPSRFEAGTPPFIEAVGLSAAISFMQEIGYASIADIEQPLYNAAYEVLTDFPNVKIYGSASHKVPLLSFTIDGVHGHDVSQILDHYGVAVRSGQHCAHPLLKHLGVKNAIRVSFGVYNNMDDIHQLQEGLQAVKRILL